MYIFGYYTIDIYMSNIYLIKKSDISTYDVYIYD